MTQNAYGTPILQLRHGGRVVNLVSRGDGLHLDDWTPAVAPYKDEAGWIDSPLADGRRPLLDKRANAIESFSLVANGPTQDVVIAHVRALQGVLAAATRYWTEAWATEPVVLEARGPAETQTRYAVVYQGRLETEDNPFAQPFFSPFAVMGMDELTVTLERGPWQDAYPVPRSGLPREQNVSLKTPLQGPTTDPVYVANRGNPYGVSHAFVYDASAGTYSANLRDGEPPYTLLPSPVGEGDCLYLGVEVYDGTYFTASSIHLALSQGATYGGSAGVVWEYWGTAGSWGEGWQEFNGGDRHLSAYDDTNGLRWAGTFCWNQDEYVNELTCLVSTTVNGVAGYWVRARVVLDGGMMTAPVADGYLDSVLNPYADLAADDEDGDLPSLLSLAVQNVSFTENYGPPHTTAWQATDSNTKRSYASRLLVAARSLSRGADFTPYLYFASRESPLAARTTIDDPEHVEFGGTRRGATGSEIRMLYPPETDDFVDRATITIPGEIAGQYCGRYRVFLLGVTSTLVQEPSYVRVRVTTGLGAAAHTVDQPVWGAHWGEARYLPLDLGVLTMPGAEALGDDERLSGIQVTLQTRHDQSPLLFTVRGVVLWPVDEWHGEFTNRGLDHEGWLRPSGEQVGRTLTLDSTASPKRPLAARIADARGAVAFWQCLAPGPLEVPPGEAMRLWFLADALESPSRMRPELLHKVWVTKVRRYLGARGGV